MGYTQGIWNLSKYDQATEHLTKIKQKDIGASARHLFQAGRSKASDPKRLLSQLPDLVRTTTQIATFKATVQRSTTHRHLFLPKDYSGSPTASLYTPWTEAEVLSHLAIGWGEGAITELKLEYLYGPEPEVSGE